MFFFFNFGFVVINSIEGPTVACTFILESPIRRNCFKDAWQEESNV